jgi:hypothetical protein
MSIQSPRISIDYDLFGELQQRIAQPDPAYWYVAFDTTYITM